MRGTASTADGVPNSGETADVPGFRNHVRRKRHDAIKHVAAISLYSAAD